MTKDNHGVTDSCLDYDRNGEENCFTEIAGILLSLQSSGHLSYTRNWT